MRMQGVSAPSELIRAEDHIDLPLGTILVDEDSQEQIFIGWRRNTAGHEMVFIRPYFKNKFRTLVWTMTEPFVYHASMLGTLLRKFPGLKEYVK